jgi:1-deoxy-D-xylulose-5-phosphate reductoisomerase
LKKIIIYGSTGSIGTQALNIVRKFKNKFKIVALTCGENISLLNSQIKEFKPEFVCVKNCEDIKKVDFKGPIFSGSKGIQRLISETSADISLVAIVGTEGIIPAYLSVRNSKLIALANKESLVSAGKFIMEAAEKGNVPIIPVDSEHSAVFQCIQKKDEIRKIILTASGGPFLHTGKEEFRNITVKKALNHPTWSMGNKITIDSATLMNKGLEIIEAKWLFNLSPDKIDVVIHPQSIVHSMVEYIDGAVIAQLGSPNMEIPISYALFYPSRANLQESLNLCNANLQFFKPDTDKFPTLTYAYEALKLGKGYPAAINKANEIAVDKFLKKEISFTDIFKIIEKVFNYEFPKNFSSIEDVFRINREVEKIVE